MRQLVNPRTFGRPAIGLALFGCRNRPFYHIAVFPDPRLGRRWSGNIIEQIGTFDPLPNYKNEKLVSLNIGRIKYWIGTRNASVSVTVCELLGIAGLLPIHPKTFQRAKSGRALLAAETTAESEQPQDGEEGEAATADERAQASQ